MSTQNFNPPPLPSCGFGVNNETVVDQRQWMRSTVAEHLKSVQHETQNSQSAEEEARELLRTFRKRHTNATKMFLSVHLRKVNSIIQEGPKCGQVAISMAAQTLYPDRISNPDEVFKTAKTKGYTKLGEMFSAKDMCDLASIVLERECLLFHGVPDDMKSHVMQHLMADRLILIPYDRDHNNEPCKKNGTKAHWALLSGVLLPITEVLTDHQAFTKVDQEFDNLYHATAVSNRERLSSLTGSFLQNVCVFANQGKSLHTQLWCLDSLIASNAQLEELDPDIARSIDDYQIPEEGIESGLKGSVICVL